MPLVRGLTTLRRRCAALVPTPNPIRAVALALVMAPVAIATAADPTSEKALLLDQNIQALKDEVLQFNRDALIAEENYQYPEHSRVEVYVSVETQALLLQRITVSIDGGEPLTYTYKDSDARSLVRSRGLQRLGRFNVSKGAHKISADFVAQYADAKEGEPIITDRIDAVFDKALTATTLELVVGKARRGGKPVLRLQEWRASK